MNHPLDVLVLGFHHHTYREFTIQARKYLKYHEWVRSFGSTDSFSEAEILISQGIVNTVLIDPRGFQLSQMVPFIFRQRKLHPEILFILCKDKVKHKRLCSEWPQFEHYFMIHPEWLPPLRFQNEYFNNDEFSKVNEVFALCQLSLYEYFNYDIAISFSGNERGQAREIAENLKEKGNRVFFDEFVRDELLGKDLYSYLHNIYSREARYCILLASESYSRRAWTNHERRSSQERSLNQAGGEYILPVKIDNTKLPGIFSTIGYVSLSKGARYVANLAHQKLWRIPEPTNKHIFGSKKPKEY